MRHPVWYVLNKTQAIIEFDREIFLEVAHNREEKYEYIQTFDDNNIVEYNTIVINIQSALGVKRIEEVAELYDIQPNEIRYYKNETDLVFRFVKPMQKAVVLNISNTLQQLYFSDTRYFTFFAPDEIKTVSDQYLNITSVQLASIWINNARKPAINDVENADAITSAMMLDPVDVLSKLKRHEKVDVWLGVVIGYGWILDYVLKALKSTEATYKFFNEYYNLGFADTDHSMWHYMDIWVGIMWEWIVSVWDKLMIINDKWVSKELTDFQISVHYKITRPTGVSYVVSLLKSDIEVKHIEWPSTFSEVKISEFVSSFWPFHVTTSKDNLKKLHEMISSAKVPEITVFNKYGKLKYNNEDIIVYRDYVYCIDRKVAVPKLQNSRFYFIDWINGIKIEGKDGTDIELMLNDKAPGLGNCVSHKYDEFLRVVKEVFTDTSGELLLMTAMTWISHSIFESEKSCPMFFTTWITGSGKTTYAKYLCAIYWLKKPVSIEGTTPFPLRISLTLLNQIPVFLNEFRSKMWGAMEKISILKSLFDGTAFERWRKDLTIESHTFSAYVFMEGEELPASGATRSRSLIWRVKKSWQGNASPEDILKENRELLSSFIYSYMKWAKKNLYLAAYMEGEWLFRKKWYEARIVDNICLMYAWAMAFAPEHKERHIAVCKEVLDRQIEDFANNGTIAEIINIIGKYIGSRFAKVYVDGYSIVLSWNDILDYIERSRITTELKADSYREHCEAFGIESWFFLVRNEDTFANEEVMVDWLRIPVDWIDKRFLCNPTVFKLWSSFNKVTKQ